MQLPIVAPAPLVSTHAPAFRHLFSDVRQFEHFQNYVTGLIVLENKSLANISRCLLESADKTNLSRFLSESPWSSEAVNRFRIQYVLGQTTGMRGSEKDGYLIFDDTLCEHVGSLFEYVDRHYNHSDGTYPFAHNLVTSYYLNGAVRIPVDFQLYRRYEEVTQWQSFVQKYCPEQVIPTTAKARQSLHKQLDKELLKDPEFAHLHDQFRTKIEISQVLLQQAIDHELAFSTVLVDSWYLSPELVASLAAAGKDWVSLLKRNRNLETHSFQLKDAHGNPILLSGPHLQVEALVPLIPASAYRPVTLNEHTYWCFSFCPRIPGLGKVRLVISFNNSKLSGTYAVLITNRTDWSAHQILDKYLHRWPIETMFQVITDTFHCELKPLGYPRAALFVFCVALVAFNILSIVRAALKQVHGVEVIDQTLSNYYVVEEVQSTFRGMEIAIPADEWEIFGTMSVPEFAQCLRHWAEGVNLKRFRKHPRAPKKPKNKKPFDPKHPHVSTDRLLKSSTKKSP